MASEKNLLRALHLLTTARVESLPSARRDPVNQLRQVFDTPNVVAVGIAQKLTKGKPTGKLALTFYVEKKIDSRKLRGHEMVPVAMPESLSGKEVVTTDVVELGRLRPEVNVTRRPVQPGNSVGHVLVTAGTLGAVVLKGGKCQLLSNSHVLANSGKGKIGDVILYPGKADGGRQPRRRGPARQVQEVRDGRTVRQ